METEFTCCHTAAGGRAPIQATAPPPGLAVADVYKVASDPAGLGYLDVGPSLRGLVGFQGRNGLIKVMTVMSTFLTVIELLPHSKHSLVSSSSTRQLYRQPSPFHWGNRGLVRLSNLTISKVRLISNPVRTRIWDQEWSYKLWFHRHCATLPPVNNHPEIIWLPFTGPL